MHHQVNWDGERKQQNKTHLMLGNIGSEGRVAGSLLLFLVEVACQLVWLHVFLFLSCLCMSAGFQLICSHFLFTHSDLRGAVRVCMGARERGRVAANSPLALRPVPVSSATVRARDCVFSGVGSFLH